MDKLQKTEMERFASILSTGAWPVAIIYLKPPKDGVPGGLGVADTASTAGVSKSLGLPVQQLLEHWLKEAVVAVQSSDSEHAIIPVSTNIFTPSSN